MAAEGAVENPDPIVWGSSVDGKDAVLSTEIDASDSKAEVSRTEKEVEQGQDIFDRISSGIQHFFAENLLAKLGGVFVFLGVLFFLHLLYTAVGPVAKLMISFGVGFTLYVAGVLLDKNTHVNEGRILMGVGILVNYLTILSGAYMVSNGDTAVLTQELTLLLLVCNTLFAILTSLVYSSRTLLLFSLVFAAINPFFVSSLLFSGGMIIIGYVLVLAIA